MTFDEIQSIWNSQQPMDETIDKDELQKWMRAKNQSFARWVGISELAMIAVLLFLTFMFARDPLLEGHDRILLLASIGSLLAAGYIFSQRIARKRREVDYQENLLGIVTKSLDVVNYQITRLRNFVWWFAAPASLGLGIGLFIIDDSRRYLLTFVFIPAFAICMGLAYWQIRKEILRDLSPEKERLEKLKRDLESADQ